jgi:hypothetical protein
MVRWQHLASSSCSQRRSWRISKRCRIASGATMPRVCSGSSRSPAIPKFAICSTLPFWEIFGLLEEAGELQSYRTLNGQWLVSLDGTQYFASSKIHCKRCTVKVRHGVEYYAHTAITPVLVAPSQSRVISLEPEFIQQTLVSSSRRTLGPACGDAVGR